MTSASNGAGALSLKPCPYCGGDGYITEECDTFCAQCSDCYAAVGEAYDRSAMPEHMFRSGEAAAEAWNRRDVREGAPLVGVEAGEEGKARLPLPAASGAASGWMKIETAPKDGTMILLFFPAYRDQPIGAYRFSDVSEPAWESLDGWGDVEGEDSPSHWMPLSAPPPSVDGLDAGEKDRLPHFAASADIASKIAVAVMALPWTAGGDEDEHGDRYGDVQMAAFRTLARNPMSSDWGDRALTAAELILAYMGEGGEASKEPGADPVRDKVCRIIEDALTAERAALTASPAGDDPKDGLPQVPAYAAGLGPAQVDKLLGAAGRLSRCLLPIEMALAERDMAGDPIGDEEVVLSFMGSGASDIVTAGEVRAALAFPRSGDDPKALDAAARSSSTEAVEQEVERLREALAFYADPDNWVDTPSWDGDPDVFTPKAIPIRVNEEGQPCDCGDTARAALSTPAPEEGLPRGSASAAEGVQEDFRSVALWADETFGPATPIRRLERAGEELDEAKTAEPDKLMEEIADVVICLAAAAHSAGGDLQAAIDAKMAINRARRWNVMGDGTGYHIPQDASAEAGDGAAAALPSPLPSQGEPVADEAMTFAIKEWGHRWVNNEMHGLKEFVRLALAAERARADSLKAERDEARADLAWMTENRAGWQTAATVARNGIAAAEARADRAGEDVLDRLVSASQEEPSPPYRVAIREFLRQQRAALRARAIIKETPHDA